MAETWLYQMSGDIWDERRYRLQVWEGQTIFWPVPSVRGESRPKAGELVICWYAKSVTDSPGIYGWGVVMAYDEEDTTGELAWRPAFPSDALKMHPLFDPEVARRVDTIRGKMPRGTMWPIDRDDASWIADRIEEQIRKGSRDQRP